jgi:ribonuclease HI
MSIQIFTDGSARGNPGPGGWGTVISTEENVMELGGREDHTTNNRMELMAAIRALDYVKESGMGKEKIEVNSDSKYVITGITEWIFGWRQKGWRTAAKKDVLNRDLWEMLGVAGHMGHNGNERCDEIATKMADKEDPNLYSGSKSKYPIKL